MTDVAQTNVVVLRRVGVGYSVPGGKALSLSGALFKALSDVFPEGKPERFQRLRVAFALPEHRQTNEPSASSDGELRSLTEVAATNLVFRCSAVCDQVERRYGNDAGTDTVMSALRAMAADPDLNAFVLMAVDGRESSEQQGTGPPVAAALVLTRAGTPEDEVRVIGAHEVHHWATPMLDHALSLAMGSALKKSGCTMADIERIVVSSSASLTGDAVEAAARSLCAATLWGGQVHTQEDFAGPQCAAAGAFDLAYEAMLLRYYAKHGQRFLWVSRTANTTCAVVLRQDGGRRADT